MIVGNREDTFKYEKIVFEDKAIDVNHRYVKLYNKLSSEYGSNLEERVEKYKGLILNTDESQRETIKQVYDKLAKEQIEYKAFQNTFLKSITFLENEYKNYLIDASFNNDKEQLSGLLSPKELGFDLCAEVDKGEGIDFWRDQTLWKKSSSHGAYVYSPTYSFYIYDELKDTDIKNGEWKIDKAKLLHLIEIEHLRWARFHYADGWTYDSENENMDRDERERFKYHRSLLPYSLIDSNTYRFDIANVVYAIQNTFDEVKNYKDTCQEQEEE